MSRHRAVRNLDLDGSLLLAAVLTLLEYLDGGDDEFYEDEGNGSIQFLRLAANSIQERCQPKILVLSISYLVSVC